MKRAIVLVLYLVNFILLYNNVVAQEAMIGLGKDISQKNYGKNNFFKNGEIHLIPSSHQDIGWENTPEWCANFRAEKVIIPVINMSLKNPDYRFSLEYSLKMMEFLERHPELQNTLIDLTEKGNIEWGATYNQPYEGMYFDESLVRQVYFGKRYLKSMAPGATFTTAWNPDVPSRTLQMPQILEKAGIKFMNISRFEAGFYNWSSPNGSKVITYSSGHYSHCDWPFNYYDRNLHRKAIRSYADSKAGIEEVLLRAEDYYKKHKLPPIIPIITSKDISEPQDLTPFINEWNSKAKENNLPIMKYSTFQGFMQKIHREENNYLKVKGEWPNVWLYIHGPTHHQTVNYGREAARLLPAVEKLASANALRAANFEGYPASSLNKAWSNAIYPDHGWGGVNGHITDSVFNAKMLSARNTARNLMNLELQVLAKDIKHSTEGIPVVVYNRHNWPVTAPVSLTFNTYGFADRVNARNLNFRLVDSNNVEAKYQTGINESEDPLFLIEFVAENVPPMGYKTYYLQQSNVKKEITVQQTSDMYENDFYKVVFGKGGIKSIVDKKLNIELLRTDKFAGGEIFQMESVGTDAGEFDAVEKPDSKAYFEKLSDYNHKWALLEDGDVKVTFETTQRIKNASIRFRVSLYHKVPKLDFEYDLLGWEGVPHREFRVAFPLNMQNANVSYNVPYGVVQVGKDELEGAAGYSHERLNYTNEIKTVRPREVQDWFHANDGKNGVTISSSVAVFDWLDPTHNPVDYTILQGLLLATRKSCNGKGNWYLQTGKHSFKFSLYSHAGNWQNCYKQAVDLNQPLLSTYLGAANVKKDTGISPVGSLFNLTDNEVIVSTIKKAEQGDAFVLRLYDITGKQHQLDANMFENFVTYKTNIIEDEPILLMKIEKKPLIEVAPYSIETYKFSIKK